jgi:hypothetical protein
MSAREEQYISCYGSYTAQNALSPCSYLAWRFASRAAVAKQLPIRALRADLCRAATLIFAVVPLDEVAIDVRYGLESGQGASSAGALQGAGKNLGENQVS